MYTVGDQVVYGTHGVCQVVEIAGRTTGGKREEYYVLQPLSRDGAVYYVPTANETAVGKMKTLLTPAAMRELLSSGQVRTDSWIPDENRRKQRYRELLTSGDREGLLNMVYTLQQHRTTQISAGRKFHLCDEAFLRDAEKLLSSEISVVLDMPQEEVPRFLRENLKVPS